MPSMPAAAAVVALAVLVPTAAHAEYLATRRAGDARPPVAAKTTKPERTPARVSMRAAEPPASAARGLDVDDVLAKLNGAYMAGLQRCYRKTLAVDPTLSGKVDLRFSVDANGRVVSAMHGAGFERCLSNVMSGWRFGVALDDTGRPTEASFRVSLMLQRS